MSTVFQYKRTENEHNNEYHGRSTTTTASSSSTSSQLCQIEAAARISCEALREKYAECIGRPMPPSIHRQLLLDLLDGGQYEYYRYALEEAAMAPMPSWRYVLAIVARLRREQVPPGDLMPL